MTSKDQYRQLTLRLLEDVAWGTLSEAEDERLRIKMDSLWDEMSQDERAEADRWLAQQRARAPKSLNLVDTTESEAGPLHRSSSAA